MSINTKEIETLQKQKNDLLKKVDPLIAKKKKLYSDVDITTPKSSDEKKLDKELADLFSEINALVHKIVKLKKSQNEGRGIMKEANINWKEFYTMAKDTSGHNPNFEKKYGNLMDRPHIADALKKARDFNSFLKAVKQFEVKESVNEAAKKVDEGIWPKSKLASSFQILLASELKKNFKGVFYSVGNDLYHNDKKVLSVDGNRDSVDSIIKQLKSKIKESVNEEIKVGKMVKVVNNPHWEAALGKKGPFKRKVKMIDGDNVFFTDGSNSSMKYVKEDIQPTNEAYDVELFWSGLSGNDRKIGRFLVSKNDYNKLEKNLKGHISFDLYDDTATGKILSYEDIMNAIKNTKYGKIAFKKESVNEVILEVVYTDKTDIKGSLLKSNEFTSLISPKVFNWVRGMEVKIFHSPVNTLTITDGKLEMVINIAKPISVIKPIGRVRSEIKALFNENVETLPHLKKVSNEYYVDTPFIQYSNKFGNLVHAGFGDFSLKTSGGEVYFTRTSKQMPDFVGRTHTMSGDATAIKKLIASMSSKYELNENVKKSTFTKVARILNNGKLYIY